MTDTVPSIRDIGRHAIRLNLARVAFEQFCLQGFVQVTFDELAGAAGVSRSTFLRHFRTKEDAVLFVFDPIGEEVAGALASGESLTAALGRAVETMERDTPELHAVMQLVVATPELEVGLVAKQALWLRDALPAARLAAQESDEVVTAARLASGFACVIVALRQWGAGAPDVALGSIVDRAVTVLA